LNTFILETIYNKLFNLLKPFLRDYEGHTKTNKTSNLCHIAYQHDITPNHYI